MTRSKNDLGDFLFTFVVVADTHMNQEEAQSSSPYACNALANGRTRYVLQRINRINPEFVIHLGDLINPVPALPTYGPAAANFHALAGELDCPLHLTPGNHDIGDKPVTWMPAGTVCDAYVDLYEKHFGKHYFSFDHGDFHFVVINAQLLNSGLAREREQKEWLEADLAANASKRTFLSTHYPAFVTDRDEDGSYDNIDEPERSWLLGLIEKYRPEAIFGGHVHNFWYDLIGDTECYILPSTAFVRHDYSEMYKIEPGPENGRDDGPKLGYFVVKVYEHGHVAHVVRTYGTTVAEGATLPQGPEILATPHTKENTLAPVGVDLRHPWAELIEIAASGAVDEFSRKRARNDYSMMALWEMGIRNLRVPIQDLADANTRRRMEILKRMGHRFTVFTYDVPRNNLLVDNRDLVDAWEVVVPWRDIGERVAAIKAIKDASGIPVFLSKLRTHDDSKYDGKRFNHFINHGLVLAERDAVAEFLADYRAAVDGFVFRVTRDVAPWEALQAAKALSDDLDVRTAVHIRMASGSPAEDFKDDLANANRVAEATCAALALDAGDVFLDTFLDVDRGYFARTGLVDRRCNPRMASHVVRNLHGAFATLPAGLEPAGGTSDSKARFCTLRAPGLDVHLVLPAVAGAPIETIPDVTADGAGKGRWIDLVSGEIHPIDMNGAHPANPINCAGPALLCIKG
jgi:3',5'-cyclic AMP phosphodiesterase CpdA